MGRDFNNGGGRGGRGGRGGGGFRGGRGGYQQQQQSGRLIEMGEYENTCVS